MTATVHALDRPRVSARAEIPGDVLSHRAVVDSLERLKREVRREAEQLGPHRVSRIYLTYEEVMEWPEPAPDAAPI